MRDLWVSQLAVRELNFHCIEAHRRVFSTVLAKVGSTEIPQFALLRLGDVHEPAQYFASHFRFDFHKRQGSSIHGDYVEFTEPAQVEVGVQNLESLALKEIYCRLFPGLSNSPLTWAFHQPVLTLSFKARGTSTVISSTLNSAKQNGHFTVDPAPCPSGRVTYMLQSGQCTAFRLSSSIP